VNNEKEGLEVMLPKRWLLRVAKADRIVLRRAGGAATRPRWSAFRQEAPSAPPTCLSPAF